MIFSGLLAVSTATATGILALFGGYWFLSAAFDDIPKPTRQQIIVDGSLIVALSAVAVFLPAGVPTHAIAVFAATVIAAGLIDARTRYLPDILTIPLLMAGTLLSVAWPAMTPISANQAIIGANFGFGLFLVSAASFEALTGKPVMNGGDLKFLAAIGAWIGAKALVVVLGLAAISLIVWTLINQLRSRRCETTPYGPHLSVGIAILVLLPGSF